VVDISHINSVSVSQDKKTATVGAGIRLGALYTALNNYGLTFHGGICPTVGLGGYVGVGGMCRALRPMHDPSQLALCAGYNIQGRQYGMAVDDVTSMEIVLATGEIVTASSTINHDLWWGARGGGTYGIVVSITINTQVFPRSATVNIQFPNASTRYEVARKYIDWAPRQVVEFGSQINMYRQVIVE
jgi:FAD/FMN-containing dehydrogenase